MNGHVEKREGKKGVRWHIVYYVDKAHGGPARRSGGTFARQKDALARLGDILKEYREGTYREPSTLTVEQLLNRWLRDRVAVDRKPTTYQHHVSNVRLHITPTLGDTLARLLTPADVAEWQAALLTGGRRDGKAGGCAVKSVLDYRATLHAAFAWAVRLRIVDQNPVAVVPAPKLVRAKPTPPGVEAIKRFLAVLEKDSPRLHLPLTIAALTGMRRGEVLALRWCDVDLRAGVAHVTRNLTGRVAGELHVGTPKTAAGVRDVALPPYAVTLLRRELATRRGKCAIAGKRFHRDGLICCGGDGQMIVPDQLTHGLARFRQRHNLPRIHMHLLRHAVATTMRESGERLEVVQEHLGHAHPSITASMYGFVRPEAKQAAAERFGELWLQAEKGPESGPIPPSGQQMDIKSASADELAARRSRKQPA